MTTRANVCGGVEGIIGDDLIIIEGRTGLPRAERESLEKEERDRSDESNAPLFIRINQ